MELLDGPLRVLGQRELNETEAAVPAVRLVYQERSPHWRHVAEELGEGVPIYSKVHAPYEDGGRVLRVLQVRHLSCVACTQSYAHSIERRALWLDGHDWGATL